MVNGQILQTQEFVDGGTLGMGLGHALGIVFFFVNGHRLFQQRKGLCVVPAVFVDDGQIVQGVRA